LGNSKYYRSETVTKRADEILARYEANTGVMISTPIPIERIAENLLDLQILWQNMPDKDEDTVLAGLSPKKKTIVFNETRLPLFDKTPGLYRTVLAHEIGHWELHVDKAILNQTSMPGIDAPLQFLFYSESKSWDEKNAHLFMSHLLVPEALLNPLIQESQVFTWTFLYKLRDLFQVTISAIRIRLERKGLMYVDADGLIHRSRAEYNGQKRML
jgi:Zn-dependent peptidase ImmA (M78 family)